LCPRQCAPLEGRRPVVGVGLPAADDAVDDAVLAATGERFDKVARERREPKAVLADG
jgi:hypothetical protein